MAPSKEERGSVVRRTLFSQSQEVGDGWLNATVVLEIGFTPHDAPAQSQAIQAVGSGYDRGGNRRDPRLRQESFRFGSRPEDTFTPSPAQVAQAKEEDERWLEGRHHESSGSRPPTRLASMLQRKTQVLSRPSSTTSLESTQATESPASTPSSSTAKVSTPSGLGRPSRTSQRARIDSDVSSEKSSSACPKKRSPRHRK